MSLAGQDCWERLAAARRGILSTIHPDRGVDAVPVVFAIVGSALVIPIDTVKPKATTKLQRLTNLAIDDRCVLLVDHYDEDWAKLWWVRVHGRGREMPPDEASLAALAARYPAYADPATIESTIVVMPTVLVGWEAATRWG